MGTMMHKYKQLLSLFAPNESVPMMTMKKNKLSSYQRWILFFLKVYTGAPAVDTITLFL